MAKKRTSKRQRQATGAHADADAADPPVPKQAKRKQQDDSKPDELQADAQEHIKTLEEELKGGRKHANNFVTLLEFLEAKEPETITSALNALRRSFTAVGLAGDLDVGECLHGQQSDAESVLGKYRSWLADRFEEFVSATLSLVHHADDDVQALSLHTLFLFLNKECRQKSHTYLRSKRGLLVRTLNAVLTHPKLLPDLLDAIQRYLIDYDDVRYYAMRHLSSLFSSADMGSDLPARAVTVEDVEDGKPAVVKNAVQVLLRIKLDTAATEPEYFLGALKQGSEGEDHQLAVSKCSKPVVQEKLLSSCWLDLLRRKFQPTTYKVLLSLLKKHILPAVRTPLMLSDFLTDSYNTGGVTSLLALEGLFILVSRHNLEYPEFFDKLYAILQPHVFHAKYKGRFLTLLDLFLTSSHLPSYLVAAFAKRLARISLTAPASGCAAICAIVFNLLLRHPSCRVLLHRPVVGAALHPALSVTRNLLDPSQDEKQSTALASDVAPGEDPFLPDENNPNKCRALESSLWEMSTLQNHYSPLVVRMAKLLFDVNAPKQEVPTGQVIEQSYETLFEKEANWRKNQPMPLNYNKPTEFIEEFDVFRFT